MVKVEAKKPIGFIQTSICFGFKQFIIQHFFYSRHPVEPARPIGGRYYLYLMIKLYQKMIKPQCRAHSIGVGLLVHGDYNLLFSFKLAVYFLYGLHKMRAKVAK